MSFPLICIVLAVIGGRVWAQIGDQERSPAVPPGPTSFSCQGRPPGYYADLETGCKTYHVCDGHSHFMYVCPRRTLFHEKMRICDHSYLVSCGLSESKENHLTGDEVLDETNSQTEDYLSSTEPVSTTTDVPTTTILPSTERLPPRENIRRFRLKDIRSLFFIPEVNNSILERVRVREFILPVVENDLMRFKPSRKVSSRRSLCPSYCNPKFLLPGSCHPCVMIK